jgi:hypothetical protein
MKLNATPAQEFLCASAPCLSHCQSEAR